MKKKFIILIFSAVMIITGCATVNRGIEPCELVISRTDNNNIIRGSLLHIDIDKNLNTISLESGKSTVIRIPNGYHLINGLYNEPGTGAVRNSISFECFNERVFLNVEYISAGASGTGSSDIKFEIVNRTEISQSQGAATQLDNAINKSFNTLSSLIPDNLKIAILDIIPADNSSVFIQEELMVLFVNSGNFNIAERHALDAIRKEQRFQMSGEVSDETAASIGHFIGADVVITGTISGTGTQRRLRLRAINVETARVIAMSSEAI